jgi:hypothetical protein
VIVIVFVVLGAHSVRIPKEDRSTAALRRLAS